MAIDYDIKITNIFKYFVVTLVLSDSTVSLIIGVTKEYYFFYYFRFNFVICEWLLCTVSRGSIVNRMLLVIADCESFGAEKSKKCPMCQRLCLAKLGL